MRWLGQQAEALGVEIFPGFAAAEVLYDARGAVRGVATGNMGVGKDGKPTGNFQPGVELVGKYTLFAEGARGNLGRQLLDRYRLLEGRDPQTWGIGIKEVWEVDPARHKPGLVVHSAGWPLDSALTAADSSTTSRTTWSRSDWSSASATPTRTSNLSRSFSATRPTRRSARSWRAASAFPMAPAQSMQAGCRACRSWCFRVER